MQIAKRLLLLLAWLSGLAFTLAGVFKNHPFLLSLRGPKTAVIFATSLVVIMLLSRWGYWHRAGLAGRWLAVLWLLPPLSILSAEESFELTRRGVLQTEPALAGRLGRHFVVG